MSKKRKYTPLENKNEGFEKFKELDIVLNKSKSKEEKAKKYVPKSKFSSRRKKLIILGVALFFILFIVWRMFGFFSKYQYQEIDTKDIGIDEEIFKSELDSIINIALLGVDKNNISDAILIASINPTKEVPTIKLISVARDTLVKVYPKDKKEYYTKINEAYGNGGEVTTLRTLNKNFGLNIKNFISIEMKGFATIIDKIGGVDNVEITKAEKDQINGIINTTKELKDISKEMVLKEGVVHLNGPQAVAFARIRKAPTKDGNNDDFGRGDRQKEILLKIFEKAKVMPKTKIFSLIEPSLKYLKTSIKLTGLLKICRDFMGRKYKLENISIPNPNIPINRDFKIIRFGQETSTVFYDLKYCGKLINGFIYRDILPDKFIEENPPPKTLNYSGINVVTANSVKSKSGDHLKFDVKNKNDNIFNFFGKEDLKLDNFEKAKKDKNLKNQEQGQNNRKDNFKFDFSKKSIPNNKFSNKLGNNPDSKIGDITNKSNEKQNKLNKQNIEIDKTNKNIKVNKDKVKPSNNPNNPPQLQNQTKGSQSKNLSSNRSQAQDKDKNLKKPR